MNLEILEENVYYYKNAIEDPEKLVALIEESELIENIKSAVKPWEEWSACSGQMYVYGQKKPTYRSQISAIGNIEEREKAEYIINTIKSAFENVAAEYAAAKDVQEPVNLFPNFEINKYSTGTMMGGHYDQQEGDERLKFSMVMYLNDYYEGGEISFTIKGYDALTMEEKPGEDFDDPRNTDKITFGIKPEAGSVIIFPSSAPYHHTAHLIKGGYKYMVPNHWLHGETPVEDEMPDAM